MFHTKKALGMTLFFLEKNGGALNDVKLAKMMYAAERLSLEKYQRTLCDDKFFALRWGPILEAATNLAKHPNNDRAWNESLAFHPHSEGASENTVHLIGNADYQHLLNKKEIALLEKINAIFRDLNKYQAHDYCVEHFSEYKEAWEKRSPSAKRAEIKLESIFIALGYSQEDADELASNYRFYEHLKPIG